MSRVFHRQAKTVPRVAASGDGVYVKAKQEFTVFSIDLFRLTNSYNPGLCLWE